MRAFLILAAFVIAGSASAQGANICQDKQAFDLGDGATGCLLEYKPTAVTKTIRRDDGLGSKHSRDAVLIRVALFGEHTEAWSISTPRMRQICGLFLDQAKQGLGLGKVRTVVVEMRWPEVKRPTLRVGNRVMRGGTERQAAMMNRNCRAVKYF